MIGSEGGCDDWCLSCGLWLVLGGRLLGVS